MNMSFPSSWLKNKQARNQQVASWSCFWLLFFFCLIFDPDDGVDMFLWNVELSSNQKKQVASRSLLSLHFHLEDGDMFLRNVGLYPNREKRAASWTLHTWLALRHCRWSRYIFEPASSKWQAEPCLVWSSTLKMEVICSSETSEFCWTTRRWSPEDRTFHKPCHENVKLNKRNYFVFFGPGRLDSAPDEPPRGSSSVATFIKIRGRTSRTWSLISKT
jgi:hypothetical protein